MRMSLPCRFVRMHRLHYGLTKHIIHHGLFLGLLLDGQRASSLIHQWHGKHHRSRGLCTKVNKLTPSCTSDSQDERRKYWNRKEQNLPPF